MCQSDKFGWLCRVTVSEHHPLMSTDTSYKEFDQVCACVAHAFLVSCAEGEIAAASLVVTDVSAELGNR